MRQLGIIFLIALTLGFAGCSKRVKPTPEQPPVESSGGAESAGAAGSNAQSNGSGGDEDIAGPQAGLLAKRVVYFDFDSSEIKGDGTDIVGAHAKYLSNNSAARVRLEGHTDERGSREYNIGLAERRAQAVRRALLLQGASEAQISTVSYGEERPAVAGHDETAWSKNRRVEIVYLTPGAQPGGRP